MPPRDSQLMTVRVEIPPGLESLLVAELDQLGIKTTADKGGVEGRLTAAQLLHLQRWSRLSSRATVRLATVAAPDLAGLASRVRKLPWRKYTQPRQPLDIVVTSQDSRLKYKDRVASKVELAIGDALKGPRKPGGKPPREPLRVGVRVIRDKATIRVDASGELLHKRGWRLDPGRAPLRENLAVAVLHAAGWAPGEPLIDPMTGSGTFAIEAALWTLNKAPAHHRSFACERWPSWPKPKEKGPAQARDAGSLILAADRDERSVQRARKNARRASVDRRIQVRHRALTDLECDATHGLVVMNPPWGERLGDTAGTAQLHHRWSAYLRAHWAGFRVAVVVPDAGWARAAWGSNYRVVAEFRSGGTPVCVMCRDPEPTTAP
ncbi:MAG: class I SAM-dependent RNA methyltransferase [Myxococcota bacterium]